MRRGEAIVVRSRPSRMRGRLNRVVAMPLPSDDFFDPRH